MSSEEPPSLPSDDAASQGPSEPCAADASLDSLQEELISKLAVRAAETTPPSPAEIGTAQIGTAQIGTAQIAQGETPAEASDSPQRRQSIDLDRPLTPEEGAESSAGAAEPAEASELQATGSELRSAPEVAESEPRPSPGQPPSAQGPGHTAFPPFLTNPFMASYMPQPVAATGTGEPSQAPQQPGPLPPGPEDPSARFNPYTGGYFLTPSQYQDMVGQYFRSMMGAGLAETPEGQAPLPPWMAPFAGMGAGMPPFWGQMPGQMPQGPFPQPPQVLSPPQQPSPPQAEMEQGSAQMGTAQMGTAQIAQEDMPVEATEEDKALEEARASTAAEEERKAAEQRKKRLTEDDLLKKQFSEYEKEVSRRLQNQNVKKSKQKPPPPAAQSLKKVDPRELEAAFLRETGAPGTAQIGTSAPGPSDADVGWGVPLENSAGVPWRPSDSAQPTPFAPSLAQLRGQHPPQPLPAQLPAGLQAQQQALFRPHFPQATLAQAPHNGHLPQQPPMAQVPPSQAAALAAQGNGGYAYAPGAAWQHQQYQQQQQQFQQPQYPGQQYNGHPQQAYAPQLHVQTQPPSVAVAPQPQREPSPEEAPPPKALVSPPKATVPVRPPTEAVGEVGRIPPPPGEEEPVWVMRESYRQKQLRDEQRAAQAALAQADASWTEAEGAAEAVTDTLLGDGAKAPDPADASPKAAKKKEVMVHEPAVLIEGVLFRARYLGSTQLSSDGRPSKTTRMTQAQEAVSRIKVAEGEAQPATDVDLFISTEKIMVLNTDLQDIMMDHPLRTISYIADIGDIVVLMARRVSQASSGSESPESPGDVGGLRKAPKIICHVFQSDEAGFIAQSIGQAFQVAYMEFLRANGIEDPRQAAAFDYEEVLNSQEIFGDELQMFATKDAQKDVVVPKAKGEPLGVVVVESGWGSMVPTVVVANLAPGGPASRSNQLNIGDQITVCNGISLVGLPLAAAQAQIKAVRSLTAVKLCVVSTPPVVEVRIKRPDTKYQLGFSVQNGVICSLLRGGIAERGGVRVGHRIIEINQASVVAVAHEKIVNMLATAAGEIQMKTMPTSMFRLLTGQETPVYI